MNKIDKNIIKAKDRENAELPPLEPKLRKAYLILLEGTFHITRLNELSQRLIEKGNESALEVARASLVQGGACLDSSIKQMIRDCLLLMAELDQSVRRQLATRISRVLKKEKDSQTLIEMLIWREIVLDDVLKDVIDDLVSSSLQSVNELQKIQSMFGVKINISKELKNALYARNQIVHEMDIITPIPELKFDEDGKLIDDYRRQRDVKDLKKWSVELVETAHSLLRQIDIRIEELLREKNR